MKIVLFSPYLPKHTGGGEKYLLDCAKIFAQAGHSVSVACSSAMPLSETERRKIKLQYEQFLNYSLDGIEFIATPLFTKASWWRKLWWTSQFDVFYYQTDGSLFFSLANHNILHIQVPLQLDKSSWMEKLKLSNWQVKNTNSEFTKKYIERFWHTKIDLVHQPFVDAAEFADVALTNKKKIILSVGRFFCQLHSKRQDVLVEFFQTLNKMAPKIMADWQLVLIGKSEDADFAKRVAKLSKDLNIKIIHDLDRQTLLKYYKQASIYWHAAGYEVDENLHPEKVEHFGITTVEAMSAKIVPVVINKGGQKEILGRELRDCLWDDKEDCLSKTLELIQNESNRQELAQLAWQRSQQFSRERFKQILLEQLDINHS